MGFGLSLTEHFREGFETIRAGWLAVRSQKACLLQGRFVIVKDDRVDI